MVRPQVHTPREESKGFLVSSESGDPFPLPLPLGFSSTQPPLSPSPGLGDAVGRILLV